MIMQIYQTRLRIWAVTLSTKMITVNYAKRTLKSLKESAGTIAESAISPSANNAQKAIANWPKMMTPCTECVTSVTANYLILS
jgi:hypothetical protein